MTAFWALYRRDLKLAVRAGGSAITSFTFFLVLLTVFPFAFGGEARLMTRLGPAILWFGVLLATLLGLDRLFEADREDGTLAPLFGAGHAPELVVLVKALAHWTATSLPLILAMPVFGLFLGLSPLPLFTLAATLLIGTPALTLIGSLGAALTLSLRRGGLLAPLLTLPFTLPLLIFGIGTAQATMTEGASFLTPFLLLCGVSLIAIIIGLYASALALRGDLD